MSSGKTCVQWVGQAEAHKKCQCIRFLAGWRLRGSRERQPTCLGCTKTWSLRGAKGHSRPKKAPGNFWRILGTKRGKQNKDLKHEYWAEIAKKKPQRLCSLCSYLWWLGQLALDSSWFISLLQLCMQPGYSFGSCLVHCSLGSPSPTASSTKHWHLVLLSGHYSSPTYQSTVHIFH